MSEQAVVISLSEKEVKSIEDFHSPQAGFTQQQLARFLHLERLKTTHKYISPICSIISSPRLQSCAG